MNRSWFITINNYEERDIEVAKKCKAVWGAIGWHVGENSGLPHVHIALRFKTNQRPSALSKLFPRGHCEIMQGAVEDALKYLGKQGRVEEWGERAKQGHRTDLERALACNSMREAIATCPEVVARYPKGL